MKYFHVFVLIALSAISIQANSAYNGEHESKIKNVELSVDSDSIFVHLETAASPAVCSNNSVMVIDGSYSIERRQMLLSRLLMAYATSETLKFGYDKNGSCIGSYVRLHKVGII